jgi:hypothetical protein
VTAEQDGSCWTRSSLHCRLCCEIRLPFLVSSAYICIGKSSRHTRRRPSYTRHERGSLTNPILRSSTDLRIRRPVSVLSMNSAQTSTLASKSVAPLALPFAIVTFGGSSRSVASRAIFKANPNFQARQSARQEAVSWGKVRQIMDASEEPHPNGEGLPSCPYIP